MQPYGYNVAPTTDHSPFFFEYHFLNAVGLPRWSGGHTDHFRGGNLATTLYLVLAEATLLSLVAIFWPLYRYQRMGLRVPHGAAYSLYFAALGFGFMMIEIGLTQKAVLFLGNPLYALSVVLATLLASAGVGSRLLARTAWTVRRVTGPVAVLFLALVVLLIVGLTPLFQACLHLPFVLWAGVIALVMAPPLRPVPDTPGKRVLAASKLRLTSRPDVPRLSHAPSRLGYPPRGPLLLTHRQWHIYCSCCVRVPNS